MNLIRRDWHPSVKNFLRNAMVGGYNRVFNQNAKRITVLKLLLFRAIQRECRPETRSRAFEPSSIRSASLKTAATALDLRKVLSIRSVSGNTRHRLGLQEQRSVPYTARWLFQNLGGFRDSSHLPRIEWEAMCVWKLAHDLCTVVRRAIVHKSQVHPVLWIVRRYFRAGRLEPPSIEGVIATEMLRVVMFAGNAGRRRIT